MSIIIGIIAETEGLIAKGSTGVALIYVILSLVCEVLAVFAAEKMLGTI